MEVRLPTDLTLQIQKELAAGDYRGVDDLLEQALRRFLEERQAGQERREALRRIAQAVDEAGLYEKVTIPGEQ
ncbi:MAG: hypothetical protein JST93_17030 [Acidobacteria bacterium]|nr:hypothetical protein [Acidobacteriota bacterium]